MFDRSRIYVLDGAMGTMMQRYGLSGNSELHNLDNPEVIARIHREYVDAGADIIESNTFGANRIVQDGYGMSSKAYEMARSGAEIARQVADSAGRKVIVAGSIGPTSKSLSIGTDAEDPSFRPLSFDELAEAYTEQIEALAAGGVDVFLVETSMDALNVKAAIYSYLHNPCSASIPVMISASCADMSGRTLTGQTLRAFYEAVRHAQPVAFGLNCSLGAAQMKPLMAEVASFAECPVLCYPNAGLPDGMGGYGESPEDMMVSMREIMEKGCADIVGGCCGTAPEHIALLRREADAINAEREKNGRVQRKSVRSDCLVVSGLEEVKIDRSRFNVTNVGERTNVAGSRKFARLIADGDYSAAIGIAADQIEGGANVIDVNLDDAMLDSAAQMQKFVRIIQTEPSVAKVALMIDSSHWDTVLAGLKNAQGKCIVNSISLKEGEKEFVRKAREIHSLGAAMVVMAFDENGQATDYDSKIRICGRAYSLLVGAGIPPEDIIFDVNVLSIATGVGTDRRYAVDFIEAVRWIKNNLPGALTSGGISNLSFAFRGNNTVREAMHSVFLYHAARAGLDMAIVNPGMLRVYDEIDEALRNAVEDVVLDRSDEAVDILVELAGRIASQQQNVAVSGQETVSEVYYDDNPDAALAALLVRGVSDSLEDAVASALEKYGNAADVIGGPLMVGMEKVGRLFSEGRMFLPQVVKSARIMKQAVALLEPHMLAGSLIDNSARPVVVIATVRGDVHDIGKNITATVLTCNGFNVVDLGVMVDKDTILEAAAVHNASIVAVSGLISPSLRRMEELCAEMEERGMDIPLLVGGATTSALHTAVKLAPLYSHVFHCSDASATAVLSQRLVNQRYSTEAGEHQAQESLRRAYALNASAKEAESVPEGLFAYLPEGGFVPESLSDCSGIEAGELPFDEVLEYFDWKTFYAVWGIKAADYEREEVIKIKQEAETILRGMESEWNCRIMAALHWITPRTEPVFYERRGCKAPVLGLFAAAVHYGGCIQCPDCHTVHGDDAVPMMVRSLLLVLADAASEWIGARVTVPRGYKLIRPAAGYRSCPDHALKKEILEMIPGSQALGIRLTESYAMIPDASVCGFCVVHKDARY